MNDSMIGYQCIPLIEEVKDVADSAVYHLTDSPYAMTIKRIDLTKYPKQTMLLRILSDLLQGKQKIWEAIAYLSEVSLDLPKGAITVDMVRSCCLPHAR